VSIDAFRARKRRAWSRTDRGQMGSLASTMLRMSFATCFACAQPATGTTRAPADGIACEADTCDDHRDPARWTERTRALFARVGRRIGEVSRDAVSDIAEELIDDALF
jgi:hypothetical protein